MRDVRGFMNHTVQFLIVAIGIWLAISGSFAGDYFAKRRVHQCAVRLDAAVADPSAERTCLVTGKAFVERDGKLCEEDHGTTKDLCATASEKAADAHPMPGKLKPVLVTVISFVVLIGSVLFFI